MTVEELMPLQGGKTEYTLSVHACWTQSFAAICCKGLIASVDPVVSVNESVTICGVLEEHRVDSVVFFALSGV